MRTVLVLFLCLGTLAAKFDHTHNSFSEDILHKLNDNLNPSWVLAIEDWVEDNLVPESWIPFFQQAEGDFNSIVGDIFPEAKVFMREKHTWWDYVSYFRWIVNFFFGAIPWFGFSIALVILNIVLNIWLNKWWAGGNPLLIFNTLYLMIQTVASWPLIAEIPFWLRTLRFFREISVEWAWMYTITYALIILDWIYEMYWEPAKTYEEYSFIDVFGNMFLAYNIIFTLPLMPVNIAIIGKETLLEIFPPYLGADNSEELDSDDLKSTFKLQSYIDLLKGRMPDERHNQN